MSETHFDTPEQARRQEIAAARHYVAAMLKASGGKEFNLDADRIPNGAEPEIFAGLESAGWKVNFRKGRFDGDYYNFSPRTHPGSDTKTEHEGLSLIARIQSALGIGAAS